MALDCGYVPGQYMCGVHKRQRRARAHQNLAEEQKAYDRHMDPLGAYHTDFPSGCSCHLSAPCSFCVGGKEAANE